jgi:uncharacterized phage-associated protein
MISVHDGAKYFLLLTHEAPQEGIPNLTLQKLVTLAQGVHLALFETPLFAEVIEAGAARPGMPMLYQAYAHDGEPRLSPPEAFDF